MLSPFLINGLLLSKSSPLAPLLRFLGGFILDLPYSVELKELEEPYEELKELADLPKELVPPKADLVSPRLDLSNYLGISLINLDGREYIVSPFIILSLAALRLSTLRARVIPT